MKKQKKNKSPESANTSSGVKASSQKENEIKKPMIDPRLTTIIPLVETQLIPIQEVITEFAKVMLNNMANIQHRIKTLAKFEQNTTAEPNTNELHVNSTYIPKCANVKITLHVSNALANDTKIKDLQKELDEYKKDFGQKTAKVLKQCAELEVQAAKMTAVKNYLSYCSKLAQGFIIAEERNTDLTFELSSKELICWSTLLFLREMKVDEVKLFKNYLKVTYDEVKDALFKYFQFDDATEVKITVKEGTTEEQNFVSKIVTHLINIIPATTIRLQETLEEKAETKLVTSLISAQYKRDATITATEATALAINDTSPNNQVNMQQHIKTLVQETVKAHLTPSKKRKNSPGSKKPRPSLPKEKNKGETTSTATTNATKKKVAFRYPLTNDKEEACDDNNDEEAPSKKKQKKSHPSLKSKKKQNKTNKKGNQGGKKKGAKRGKQRKKND